MSQFTLDVNEFVKKAGVRGDDVVRYTHLGMGRRIILRTPVDTGRAQNNWLSKEDFPHTQILSIEDTSPSFALQELEGFAKQVKAGGVIYFTNNLDYIEYLEEGSSQQAPEGMVALTVEEFQRIVDAATERAKRRNP